MEELVTKAKKLVNNEKAIIAILFFLALIIRGIYLYNAGVAVSPDARYYIRCANSIMEQGISYYINSISHAYYWLYPSIVAVLLFVFKNSINAIIIFQILLQSFAAVIIYKICRTVFQNHIPGIIAGIIYAVLWELYRWDVYTLTESTNSFLVVLLVYLIVQYKFRPENNNKYIVPIGLVILALMLIKPATLPIIVSAFIVFFSDIKFRYKYHIAGIIVVIFAGVVAFLLMNGSNDRLSVAGYFSYFDGLFRKGIIVTGMPEYNFVPFKSSGNILLSILNMLIITVYKIYAYWWIIIGRHSLVHKLLNLVMFVPLYVFSVVGVVYSVKRGLWKRISLFIIVIASYNAFHALTEVDFDWRYRYPVIPMLIVLAAYGIYMTITAIIDFNTARKPNYMQ